MVQSFFTPVQSYSPVMSAPGPYREWKPNAALRNYIYCYWFMPGCTLQDPAAGAAERIVPDGCIDLVFQISRDFTAIKSMIVGTLERSILVDMEYGRLQSFGIRFYPGGLQPFLREPADLFTNRIIPLNDVCKAFSAHLEELIASLRSINMILPAVEDYLLTKLSGSSLREDIFRNALTDIYLTQGTITVKELSRRECISEKQLKRILLERTGLGTKAFTQVIRFQHILGLLNRKEPVTLTDAAMLGGYYDQAHFTREFKSFSGLLPSDYIKLPG